PSVTCAPTRHGGIEQREGPETSFAPRRNGPLAPRRTTLAAVPQACFASSALPWWLINEGGAFFAFSVEPLRWPGESCIWTQVPKVTDGVSQVRSTTLY